MIMRRVLSITSTVMLIMVLGVPTAAADQAGLGRYDWPLRGFSRAGTTLREATPAQARLDPEPLQRAWATIESYATAEGEDDRPLYPSAVLTYGHRGQVVMQNATGQAVKYRGGDGTELPAGEQIPARTDTIYDMASVSKLFTSIVIMTLVEDGVVDLDTPVAQYVPEFAEHEKELITVRQLLTHTSGLPAWLPLWSGAPDPVARIQMALTAELANKPGEAYTYSDLNLIALGEVAARVTGKNLDQLVAMRITGPLGMTDTGYKPAPELRQRIAATEFQATPDRGMVWGEVHDENAWSLGGVAGHAGIFSTTGDMAILAQTLLNGGAYGDTRILTDASVTAMITNENTEFEGDDHGLGFELDQRWYMDGLSGPRTAGHTGYTGTSMVLDFSSGSFVILLTNRVHPSRSGGSVNPARVAAAQGLAEALQVTPQVGRDAWFSGTEDGTTSTLDLPLDLSDRWAALSAQVFIDTESSDQLFLEATSDGGKTWMPLAYLLDGTFVEPPEGEGYAASGGRRWQQLYTALPAGTQTVRWRYVTDSALSGRGIYLDDIGVSAAGRPLVRPEQHPELLIADGWRLANR